jgi:ATP-binding cassette subfamily B protein
VSDAFEFEEEEFSTKVNSRTVRRIMGLATRHWRWLAGFVVSIACVSTLDSYFTYLSKSIIDDGIVAGNRGILIHLITRYGALIVVQAGLVLSFVYLSGVLGERIRYDLRKTLFNHLQDLSFSYFDRTPVGWIMARVTSDTDRIADLVTWGLLDVTWGIMNTITAMFFMVSINARMAIVVLAIIPVLLVVAIEFRKRILVQFRLVRKANSRITGAYNENITGVRVVKALCREEENLREFGELTGTMYRASFRAAWLSALFLPVVQIISAFALGGIVWYGGLQALHGSLTIGGIQAFISYVTFMLWPIQDIARVYAELQHAVASAERVFSLADAEPDVTDLPGAIEAGTIQGEIEFDQVDFWYEADKPVLQGFSLKVQPGETIALVGPTGGGKSTIVNLLCRFYEPRNGTIRIGGRDYRELSLQTIQSRIGVVLQTPHLFSGTVRENIRYGRLDASDEAIEDAARIAGAHDFIVTLEKGYDQEVGERGDLLSVGQKQLVSLAEIFIMDEATSSVDTLTEDLIRRGMEALLHGCTSFVIAHRLSTIKRADRILVIQQGRIVEMGSHAELIRARGYYYRLYTRQFRQQRQREFDPVAELDVSLA